MMLLPYAYAALAAGPALQPASKTTALSIPEVVPASFAAEPGQPLALTLRGQNGAALPWPEVRWMLLRVASTQRNLDDAPQDQRGQVSISLATAGTGIVGVDFEPRRHETTFEDLRAFVLERGRAADQALLQGAGPLTVDLVQSTKTVVTCGRADQADGQSESVSKSGQQVEIRPLMDPAATPIGGDIAVRTYITGAGAGGARVLATHVASGRFQDFTCDASGIGHFTLDQAGIWRIELSELRRAGNNPTLYSCTLTFEAREARP
jgi:hypothetical protein